MTKDEALAFDLALEALGLYQAAGFGNSTDFNKQHEAFYKAQTAIIVIKQAQTAPTVQPVVNASAWFALVMNAAAELEDASNCIRDEDAKRVANSGAKYYRDAANALHTTPPAAPVQEPVAWTVSGKITDWSKDFSAYQTKHYTRPVYTPPAAQRQWVGLTDEDWKELHLTTNARTYGPAIEAKLKEKNT